MKTPSSKVFQLEPVGFSTGNEYILRGSRKLFPLLPQAFQGIEQIGIVGWGSQGPAQAQNLRDSLAGSNIVVKVGLQKGSKSVEAARQAGFQVSCDCGESTLGTIEEIVPTSDLVILLIADGAQTELWERITGLMKPGATLGLSHGFLLGYLKSIGKKFRPDINVILMAPKGMGKSVRLLYLQGQTTDGAGINSSVAVEQDVNGRALDYALGWAVGTGSPATFFTTMEQEVISDLFGERAMLLGGLWGLVEALYGFFRRTGQMSPEDCFLNSAKGLTNTVSRMISKEGLRDFVAEVSSLGYGNSLRDGYVAAYPVMRRIMLEIYANVASWKEVAEVVVATAALKTTPMPSIEGSEMWSIATEHGLYEKEVPMTPALAYSAGAYIAGIIAQMNILRENGHCASEIVNESLIEAIDSLNPFMDRRGVSYMVDNCSTTARLGTRKWGPLFTAELSNVFSLTMNFRSPALKEFEESPLHGDIKTCFAFRPPVKIAVD